MHKWAKKPHPRGSFTAWAYASSTAYVRWGSIASGLPARCWSSAEDHRDPSTAASVPERASHEDGEGEQSTKVAMDPDDAPPGWADAIRRFSSSISHTTLRHFDPTDPQRPASVPTDQQAGPLLKTSRKLPKLRSARTSTPAGGEEDSVDPTHDKLTAAAVERILLAGHPEEEEHHHTHETRAHHARGTSDTRGQQFGVDEPTMRAILRYYGALPQFRAKRAELARLALR